MFMTNENKILAKMGPIRRNTIGSFRNISRCMPLLQAKQQEAWTRIVVLLLKYASNTHNIVKMHPIQ